MTLFYLRLIITTTVLLATVASQCIHPKFAIIPGHTACITASPNVEESVDLTATEKDLIVNKHNELRSLRGAANMQKMVWDDEVAAIAKKWTENCYWGHDRVRSIPGRFSVGQNLALGYSSWDAAIQGWYDEVKDFRYDSRDTMNFAAVGHFTALTWAESAKVGCAYTKCRNMAGQGKFYACNYAPQGNFQWWKPYKLGTRCSECPDSCNSDGLCDCGGKVCENGGTLDPNTCQCSCAQSYHLADSCQLNCTAAVDVWYCSRRTFADCQRYSNVPAECPNLCKHCPDAGFTGEVTQSTRSTTSSTARTTTTAATITTPTSTLTTIARRTTATTAAATTTTTPTTTPTKSITTTKASTPTTTTAHTTASTTASTAARTTASTPASTTTSTTARTTQSTSSATTSRGSITSTIGSSIASGHCLAAKYEVIPNHTACIAPSRNAQQTGDLTTDEKNFIVRLHNNYRSLRRASNMQRMVWDEELADLARRWTDNCEFEHDKVRAIPGRFAVGQNLALGPLSWQSVLQGWYNEVNGFKYNSKNRMTFNAVGHFTALTWAKSAKVGCAYTKCANLPGDGHFYSCNYAPQGNSKWWKPYSLATGQCGDCPDSCDSDGLCDCGGKVCENGGELDPNTCQCTCKHSYYLPESCELDCSSAVDQWYCSQWTFEYCTTYQNVPMDCPIMCKTCPAHSSPVKQDSDIDAKVPPDSETNTKFNDGISVGNAMKSSGRSLLCSQMSLLMLLAISCICFCLL